jgi:MinD-like ATPase involved in chromosome partitioning or flagellar assembly
VSRPVLTAVTDRWEGRLVTVLERATDLDVTRRCADLPELLAAAAAGLAAVALVSADLRSLDRAALAHLRDSGVAVVGVYPPGDEAAERQLRQLGVEAVVAADADGTLLQATVDSLTGPGPGPRAGVGPGRSRFGGAAGPPGGAAAADPLESLLVDAPRPGGGAGAHPGDGEAEAELGTGDPDHEGLLIAVWGPTGAPGRTTVAVNLATELSRTGARTLLVDADTYGGSVAQVLSLLDEAPGLAAAVRAADHGSLDLPGLARLAPEVTPGLRVLTGIPKAERWPELRAPALEHVLTLGRRLARFTVLDCGFNLEDDEELSYDTRAPRRNAATLVALALADRVLAVGAADPIGLQRLVRGLQELSVMPVPAPVVVVNKLRASAVGSHPEQRVREALARFAGVQEPRFVPDDRDALDAAVLAGRALAESAPTSPARRAIAALADDYADATTVAAGRGRWRRR